MPEPSMPQDPNRQTDQELHHVTISRLVDCDDRESIMRRIGEWFLEEWGEWPQHQSVEETVEKYRAKLNVTEAPIALVAFLDGEPIGTASLNLREMTIHPELPFWLGDLYVRPEHRLQGIGSKLMDAVVDAARTAGADAVYLYTEDQEALYARRGWSTIEQTEYDSHEVVVMKREITG